METENISIHAMPEKYRANTHHGSESAKKTGFLILIFGLLFMLLIMGGFYYFFIYSKSTDTITDITTPLSPVAVVDNNTNTKVEEANNKTMQGSNNEEAIKDIAGEEIVEEDPVMDIEEFASSTEPELATSTVETASPEVASTTPKILKGIDSDQDGIQDIEEEILGTNLKVSDSDNDSYSDLQEINGLYNPLGEGKIEDSPNFSRNINSNFNYSFLYPKKLSIDSVGDDESLVINFDNNSFFQIIAQSVAEDLTLKDWYETQFTVSDIDVTEKNGVSLIISEDENIYYLKSDKYSNIIILNYSSLDSEKVYAVISNLIINSFEFL